MMKSSTMERPSHAGLRHVALNVRALDAMKEFYVELLGLAVEWEPDADNIYLSSGIDNLALHRSSGTAEAVPDEKPDDERSTRRQPSGALDHLGLIVRAADDVDKWAAFLEGHGVALAAKPKTHRDGARS